MKPWQCIVTSDSGGTPMSVSKLPGVACQVFHLEFVNHITCQMTHVRVKSCVLIIRKAVVSWESHCAGWVLQLGPTMDGGRKVKAEDLHMHPSLMCLEWFMVFMKPLATTFLVHCRCIWNLKLNCTWWKIMRNQPRRAFEHLQSWMASRVTTFVEKQPRLNSQSNVAELLAILNDDNNEVGL